MRTEPVNTPSTKLAQEAREALRALAQIMHKGVSGLVHVQADGEASEVTFRLPPEALELLGEVLGQMAAGHAVAIVPVHPELTSHEAAEMLNVSRPYLIGLLDAGKIPYRKVGTHRRIRFMDLMTYKQQDDARRDEVLAELTQQAEDLDLGY